MCVCACAGTQNTTTTQKREAAVTVATHAKPERTERRTRTRDEQLKRLSAPGHSSLHQPQNATSCLRVHQDQQQQPIRDRGQRSDAGADHRTTSVSPGLERVLDVLEADSRTSDAAVPAGGSGGSAAAGCTVAMDTRLITVPSTRLLPTQQMSWNPPTRISSQAGVTHVTPER